MAGERKFQGFELLFKKVKNNYGKLLLVNLIFALPLALGIGAAYLINMFVHSPLLIYPLAAVVASPFYPGVVVLARDISQGDFEGEYLKRYLGAVKESWYKFLVCGVLLYLVFEICGIGIYFYIGFAMSVHWMFYIPLVFSAIIVFFLLFFFYGIFLMIPSFELKMKAVIKNSALATFGEIKQNFFATVASIVYILVMCLPFILISYLASVVPAPIVVAILTVYTLLAVVFLAPAPLSLIVSHYVYPDMLRVIGGIKTEAVETTAEEKVDKVKEEVKEEIENSKEDLEKYLVGNDDDYVFYNGKMVKRGLLRKLHEQSKGEDINEEN